MKNFFKKSIPWSYGGVLKYSLKIHFHGAVEGFKKKTIHLSRCQNLGGIGKISSIIRVYGTLKRFEKNLQFMELWVLIFLFLKNPLSTEI